MQVVMPAIKQMRNIYLIFILSLGFIVSCSPSNSATVVISNESGNEVKYLEIEVFGIKQSISHLKNGENRIIIFRDFGDSHYTLNGELKNGTLIKGAFGYVTHGMDFHDSFLIKENGAVEFNAKLY